MPVNTDALVEVLGKTIFSDGNDIRNDGHVCLDEITRANIRREVSVKVNTDLLNDKRLCLVDIYIIATTIADAIKKTMAEKIGPYNIQTRGDQIADEIEKAALQFNAQPKTDDPQV